MLLLWSQLALVRRFKCSRSQTLPRDSSRGVRARSCDDDEKEEARAGCFRLVRLLQCADVEPKEAEEQHDYNNNRTNRTMHKLQGDPPTRSLVSPAPCRGASAASRRPAAQTQHVARDGAGRTHSSPCPGACSTASPSRRTSNRRRRRGTTLARRETMSRGSRRSVGETCSSASRRKVEPGAKKAARES